MRKLITNIANGVRRLLTGTTIEAIWCAVANVVDERPVGPGGTEWRSGTRHFRPGTLVYCPTVLWGDGYENIRVVARHRGSHRFVTMVIRSAWLTNWRTKLVYSPHIIREFREMGASWDGSAKSKRLAEQIVQTMRERSDAA